MGTVQGSEEALGQNPVPFLFLCFLPTLFVPAQSPVLCPETSATTCVLMTFKLISPAWTSPLNSSFVYPTAHKIPPFGAILDPSLFYTHSQSISRCCCFSL